MDDNIYRIESADREKYEGLRGLWCRIFGDEPAFVDYVFNTFGKNDIDGYVMCDDSGKVVSALTCYKCGELYIPGVEDMNGRPVYVSYAICTDPDYRGKGLAGKLTGYVRDRIAEENGISLLSPAEESLISFYNKLGYRETCFTEEITVPDETDVPEEYENEISDRESAGRLWGIGADGSAGFIDNDDDCGEFDPGFSMSTVGAPAYNEYRERFLEDIPHVKLSPLMTEFVRSESLGGNGLFVINGGDAICTVSGSETEGELTVVELIVNPQLKAFSEEIDREIAERLAEHFGTERLICRIPAAETLPGDTEICQSMTAGLPEGMRIYYGFPVE